jgi:dATP pyrophosphohydrolase
MGIDGVQAFKIPESVLVVVHTPALNVLLLCRADWPDHWQSVTGSKDFPEESFFDAAVREVAEETGIDARAPGHRLLDWEHENEYEIWPRWRRRYADGVVRNRERVFGLCVPTGTPVVLSEREHSAFRWLPWADAAAACFSRTNAQMCRELPVRAAAFSR